MATTYEKLITHAKCVIEIDDGIWNSAIEIANYDDGANMAVECTKCNEVIMDVNRLCWYCEGDANDSHGIDLSNPYPSSVTIGQTYRISIYPTSSQVLALAKPDRWLIVDREWLDENEDAFGDDVCYHITDDVLTVDRQSLHTSASEVN